MTPNKRLTMIRHGESAANSGMRTADHESIPITELGRQQAATAAANIDVRPDLLVVSRMLRCIQSAEPLIRRFPDVPVETWPVHEFFFLNFKNEPPLTWQERKPRVDAYWQRCDPKESNPHAESFESFWSRVVLFHERAVNDSAETLVVVSHGFFMRTFAWGLSHGFPNCTPELMDTVHKESVRDPYPNSAVDRFELNLNVTRQD